MNCKKKKKKKKIGEAEKNSQCKTVLKGNNKIGLVPLPKISKT